MRFSLTVLLCFLTVIGMAEAAHPKIAADLAALPLDSDVDVIVQYKSTPGVSHHGGRLTRELKIIRSNGYRIQASRLEALANDPDVEHISLDHEVSSTGLDYHYETVHANYAQRFGLSGDGIGVAVVDSGISAQQDIAGQIVHAELFTTDGTAEDLYGHGTHVAGIIAGNGQASSGKSSFYMFNGIASDVALISLKVLNRNGVGSDSTVIAGIQRAIQLKSQYNIRVLNLSLGRPVFESYTLDPLCQAVEAAWKAGIVVVVAAGNEGRNNTAQTSGYGTIMAPGNDPYVITVGAMKTMGTQSRNDDLIASYSSKGPTLFDHIAKPDLVAPGNRIISTMAGGSYFRTSCPVCMVQQGVYTSVNPITVSDQYMTLSGTSMAAPAVSGAAALLLQMDGSLTPDQVKARLMKTASKTFPSSSTALDPVTGMVYTSYYDLFTVGAGYLDIGAALTSYDHPNGSALSPAVVYDSKSRQVTLSLGPVNGTNVIWGSNVAWGSSVVWGSNTIVGSNVIWGTNVVWGTSGLLGFNVIWGNNVVWGTTTLSSSENLAVAVNGEN